MISCITYYEIERGLFSANATQKLSNFYDFCQSIPILLLDDLAIVKTASTIHADLKRRDRPIQDADILIAATAMTKGLILVSDDTDMLIPI